MTTKQTIVKRGLKITLKVLGVILVVLILLAVGGWWYLKAKFLGFEGDYKENKDLQEVTLNGFTFLDRNGNGVLELPPLSVAAMTLQLA